MPSLSTTSRHITPSIPQDLRWKDSVKVQEGAVEIMEAAARLTVLRFAGDSATLIGRMLFDSHEDNQ